VPDRPRTRRSEHSVAETKKNHFVERHCIVVVLMQKPKFNAPKIDLSISECTKTREFDFLSRSRECLFPARYRANETQETSSDKRRERQYTYSRHVVYELLPLALLSRDLSLLGHGVSLLVLPNPLSLFFPIRLLSDRAKRLREQCVSCQCTSCPMYSTPCLLSSRSISSSFAGSTVEGGRGRRRRGRAGPPFRMREAPLIALGAERRGVARDNGTVTVSDERQIAGRNHTGRQ